VQKDPLFHQQGFFHAGPKIKKSHTDGLDVRISNPHLSFAAGFGTFAFFARLPGFIGPFPPPLLIRLYAIFF